MPTDDQLIAKSPVIIEGTVLSTEAVENGGRIWTETTVAVARALKGTTEPTIVVRELGGELADRVTMIFGRPEFTQGERVLLFLEPSPRGGYRTMDLFVGKFGEGRMLNGGRVWLRDDFAQDATLLGPDLQPLESKNVQRDAVPFEQFVRDRVAGRAGLKNYGIENPVLARDGAETSGRFGVRANFELLSEPTIYRWGRFDGGSSAAWYSVGTQSGYSGGGVSQLTTAMQAWTGYGNANIRYTYAGERSSPGGMDATNGVNEVMFNDPMSDIAGTWDGVSGVVGLGGFNAISGTSAWTATFSADTTHTARAYTAYNIAEANLTIQDGVAPGKGISSTRLAEIIAHEFGHTLGFGHSADAAALMYYSVTGLGPTLRADDQLAARWLYPKGGSSDPGPDPTPTVPAAPSGLSASASGSSIRLEWNDNATDESGQSVYYSVNGGGFQKAGDVSANVEGATMNGLSAGTYRFYVVAYNGAGTSAQSNTAQATIASAPVARFSFTPQSGTAGVTNFTFYDESTGSVTSRSWSFGDGSTSTASVATHRYAESGVYTVTLTVNGGGTSSQASAQILVSGPLTARFAFSPTSPTAGQSVSFVDQSGGAPSSWLWSFGDGTQSTLQNPSKRFSAAGTYNVTLTVYRDSLSSSSTTPIVVSNGAPVTPAINAAFDASSLNPTVGAPVAFTDLSTGGPTAWAWTFGDGSTSSVQNPSHTYALPGSYTVSLTASKGSNSSLATKQITVSAGTPYRTLVSVATQTGGVAGTSWRTELNVFNAGSQGANVSLLFIPASGGSAQTRALFLSPKQSMTYANALRDVFGIENGAGALGIEASSAGAVADLRITSRTFTTSSAGTYGQSVPDVLPSSLAKTLYVTGIANSAKYRTNVGLVNRAAGDVSATLTLFNTTGATLASATTMLPANSFQQMPLTALFPQLGSGTYDLLTLRISSATADAVSAYASVVDNATQDPVYVQAVPTLGGSSTTIPVVGRSPGLNGTFWRSDVSVYNPNATQMQLTLDYRGATKNVTLGGNDTTLLADVLATFGQTSGQGLLRVSWSSAVGPVVTSRTYTSVASGGTFGQSIDPVADLGSSIFVPGLRNDGSYRTNVGVVNGGSFAETFTLRLLSVAGNEIAKTTLSIGAGEQAQYGVAALFPNASLGAGFTLHVEGDGNAQLFGYASMVDNASGDPVFFAGR